MLSISPFLQFIFALSVIILAAKSAGFFSVRVLKQPAILGELLIGLLLGPSLLDFLHFFPDHPEEMIHNLAELGVLMLMFLAGLELHLNELARHAKVSAFAGVMGVVVPVGLGFAAGQFFGFDPAQSLFLGLTLGATSVSISAQTLMELKVLRTRVGLGLLGAAVFDDILVLLFLSIFLALQGGGGDIWSVVQVLLGMVVFLTIAVLFGLYVLPRLARAVSRLPISQGTLALALIVMMVYGLAAELVGGMAAITGTFLAGLMYARTPEKDSLERSVSALAYGLFVPVFFINIGLSIDLRTFSMDTLWLLVVISVLAVLGKLFGSGLGARAAGFTTRESFQLGAGMVSRGEVGLIMATVGIERGLLQSDGVSALIGMILLTTLLTPPLLRYLFKSPKQPDLGKASIAGSGVEK
jgi:Kef-type K+ transport system membrane component KefB